MPRSNNDEAVETAKKTSQLDERIDEFLLKQRRVFLSSQVDDASARAVIRKLWYLDSLDSSKPILFVIHSPGGSVDSGLAIWDQIKMISAPVYTLVTGLAASMGSVLSLAAEKGKRFASPMARIMIHQPMISGVMHGQATDLEIQAKEILKTREQLVGLYAEKTGKDRAAIEKALDRDTWMNAQEALAFGLIDKIVTSFKDFEKM
ncbi:MAG: ATP-dependent Clp protease proteolytic subunit [Verrucomicrobia bacterium]|jgi:ATP-dependent Clp protease protease subunit|nr:ATP-dependent Clp protease proteolytic subunit [Verrucomicrobiota bacterium]